jgi:death-on-curing protein
MRYLTLNEVLELHYHILEQSGGAAGIRDEGALESAIAQPRITFDQKELYPTLVDKAASLGYSLIKNHCFVDGNKRIGHAAMEIFLLLNGYEIIAGIGEQEQLILAIAAGRLNRNDLQLWLSDHISAITLSNSSSGL